MGGSALAYTNCSNMYLGSETLPGPTGASPVTPPSWVGGVETNYTLPVGVIDVRLIDLTTRGQESKNCHFTQSRGIVVSPCRAHVPVCICMGFLPFPRYCVYVSPLRRCGHLSVPPWSYWNTHSFILSVALLTRFLTCIKSTEPPCNHADS